MESKKLLPCPFCGGEAQIDRLTDSEGIPLDEYGVSCVPCNFGLEVMRTPEDCRVAWNRRSDKSGLLRAAEIGKQVGMECFDPDGGCEMDGEKAVHDEYCKAYRDGADEAVRRIRKEAEG